MDLRQEKARADEAEEALRQEKARADNEKALADQSEARARVVIKKRLREACDAAVDEVLMPRAKRAAVGDSIESEAVETEAEGSVVTGVGNDLNRAITPAEIWEAYQILDQRSECNLERARGNLPGGWTFMKRLKPNSTACDKYFWAPSVPTGKNGVKFGCEGYYNSVKNFRLAIGQPHQ